MKRFILVPLVFVLVTGLVLGGCAAPVPTPAPAPTPGPAPAPAPTPGPAPSPTPTPAPAPEKTWVLKMHSEAPAFSALHKDALQVWADGVAKATNGRVKIDIFPGSALISTKDTWEGVKRAVVDIAWIPPGIMPGQFDLTDGSVSLPFLFPSSKVGSRVVWALYEKFPEVQKEFAGAKVLVLFTTEPYIFISREKPIKVLEDLKGMKVRAAGAVPQEMVKLLGAKPMMVPMPETYLNLQTGVVDAMLAPVMAIGDFRLYEVVKYYTIVPTVCCSEVFVMNQDVWNEFPPDIQKAIMNVSGEAAGIMVAENHFDKGLEVMPGVAEKAGYKWDAYTLPKEELDRWKEAAGKPVRDKWMADMEARGYTKVREIHEEVLRLAKQFSAEE